MGTFSVSEATQLALAGFNHTSRRSRLTTPRLDRRVLQGSIEAGTFEETFFAIPGKGETDQLLRVARRTLDASRRLRRDARAGSRILTASERVISSLTNAAVRVYEELLTLARLNRGRVFPSYNHLADATGLGRASVARALHILEAIGFLKKQRRFKRVATVDGRQHYAQTSNVYRALLPQHVLSYLPRWLRPTPIPCDEAQQSSERAAEFRRMLTSLSCRELAQVTLEGPLGRAFAKLGDSLDRLQCESQTDTEQLTESI